MNFVRHRKLSGLAIITMAFIFSCQKEAEVDLPKPGTVSVQFLHQVDNEMLNLNAPFLNPFGEEYSVSKFKYYITNIQFLKTGTNARVDINDTYYLVDEADASTKNFSVKVPAGNYSGISFLIGVDSLHNVSGAQTGALDPAKDMFWTWNTGYIMAKLEGVSPLSPLPQQMIEFHIGGFKEPFNTASRVDLNFPVNHQVSEADDISIAITVNLNAWFKHAYDLPLSVNPTCTSPGSLANQYSENFSGMFSIMSVSGD